MSQIFYMNGFNVAPDEIVYLNLSNPSGQLKPGASVFNAGGFILSPDGSKIVYHLESGSSARLRRGDINPSSNFAIQNTAVLTSGTTGTDREPTFAPDNYRLAFVRLNQIYTINLDSTAQVNISQNSFQDRHPDWSPDGGQIAFASDRNGGWDIYLASPTNFGQAQRLTQVTFESMSELTWSPDGTRIAFIGRETSNDVLNLHIVNVANGSIQNLTSSSSQERSPSWSPNGDQLAFVRLISAWRIYTIRPDGRDETFLVQPSGSDIRQLSWRLLPPNHNGGSYCPINMAANDQSANANPISLRLGEKREQVTDLALTTPAGTLDFTRVYRQSKQDDYQGMGLGWTHNHDLFIDDRVSNKLIATLPNGGQAQFSRVGSTDQYNGDPGSNSAIVVNPMSTDERYTLTASDQSIHIFDDQKRLRSRQWANGETWTYTYYTTGYADGMLQEVDDGYGRKLQFVYVDNFGEYDHLQLWRVGDQETSDLDGTTPSGRYIEFVYTDEKLDGVPITGAKALLHQLQDVRGQIWSYHYYGQEAGETDGDQANFLVEVVSPEVDIDGDETPDLSIVLKHLTYTLSGGEVRHILQERGFLEGTNPNTALMRTAYKFLRMQTTEEIVDTQRVITHRFAGGMLAGSKDAAGNGGSQLITASYRPAKQIDANGNDTTLNWSSNGKLLNSVRDALDHETQFVYDMQERLFRSTDAQGRITEYTYGDSNVPRQPTVIQVFDSDGTTLLRQQEFDYDSLGRTLEERTIDPADGTTVLQKTTRTYHTSGNGNGLLESVTQVDLEDAGNNQSTSYTYDSAGRVIKTQRSSLFGSCDIAFTVYDLAGNVVATICNYNPGMNPDPTDAAEAAALYNPAEPNKNRVTTHRYDEMGRRVATTTKAGAEFAQTTLTLYDALDRPWRVISNYVNPLVSEDPDEYAYTAPGTWVWDETNGRWQDGDETPISHGDDRNQNLISDTAYNARGLTRMQRAVLGNVTLFGYDDADRLVKTVQHASDPDYDNDYSSGDPDLSSYVEDTTATDVDIITQQAYDPAGNLIKAVNPLGITDLTAYDALNRPVQVVSSASNPDYNLLGYGSFSQYVFSDVPDRDLRRTTSYDALGRTLQTGQIIAKTGAAETWVYTRQVYDALGRQRLMVRNYIDQGEDPALWVWDEAEARWEQSDGTPIEHGAHNDQNIISEQVYDEAGRVRFSRDMAGAKNWQVYDGLGRGVKQIAGCTYTGGSPAPEDSSYVGAVDDSAADIIHETYFDVDGRVAKTRRLLRYDAGEDELVWVWTLTGYDVLGRQVKTVQNASDPDYNLSADPDLSAYTPSSQPDEDIITETAYDAEGRVYKTTDTLDSVTLYGFDTSGRQVKVIRSASDPDYDVTADPDLSSYTPSAESDEDLISQTEYDIAGRVVKVTDALGHVTLYGYDRAGRQVKVIQNASDSEYDVAVDPDLSSYTGDNPDPDQDRSTETAYDKAGRTIRMTDAQGNVTLTGYDRAGRQVKVIQNASDPDYDVTIDPDLSSYTGDNPGTDQDRIIATAYDKGGRAISQTDASGVITRHVYDHLGRRLRSVGGYLAQGATDPVDWLWNSTRRRWEDGAGSPLDHGASFDHNLISDTAYDLAGRVSATRDMRGTLTTFSYDRLGRRLNVTEAVDTDLETVSYTCYDKAGRVERFIRNWQDTGISPDAKDENGDWVFNPTWHGSHNDRNLITMYQHDLAGRRTVTTDPAGNTATTSYFRDGQVDTETDPEGMVTTCRYDGLRRRVLVVQSFVATSEDPAEWVWDAGDGHYEESDGTPIGHGADSDQNIIVQVTYDKGGRLTSLRDPCGSLTEYDYDRLGRRTKLTNALNDDWLTAYEDLVGGGARVTTTYPGLASGGVYSVQRDFDRLGRPVVIDYGAASVTPRVTFEYDPAGNRAVMREYDDSQQIRKTSYVYDTVRRLVGVGFDTDGDDNTDETVSYAYDLGGSRTKLTLPGDLSISYRYDAKGQLVGLTDWDGQASDFFYDRAGRQVGTQRPNGLLSDYLYNPAGHLRRIRHFVGSLSSLRAHFEFQVDGRGNRTQAYERMAEPTTITDTYDKDAAEVDYAAGTWADDGDFKKSTQFSAKMTVIWTGDEGLLTMGTGPDHSLFDVYIGGSLWQSYDGYTADPGERVIHLPVDARLEIRNRADRNIRSSGYVIRFKQLDALAVTYDERTIQYTYDALSRLLSAEYISTSKRFDYTFDLAGNRTSETIDSGTPTTYSYNTANQITNTGFVYDANGNLTSDGTNSYDWDRANRLLSMGGIDYVYDGDGQRISQTAASIATKYLLDIQPALANVLSQTVDTDTSYFVHSPRGIHAMQNPSGAWSYASQDGLGSVRQEVDAVGAVLAIGDHQPFGVLENVQGTFGLPFRFTGEQTDSNELVYLRKRYLNPRLGIFPSLDPFEGTMQRPMSLNGYSWVEGNPVMNVDPSGRCMDGLVFANLLQQGNITGGAQGSTDCERFIDELRGVTQNFISEINSPQPAVSIFGVTLFNMKPVDIYNAETLRRVYASFLGQLYAGVPFEVKGIPFLLRWGGGGQSERYGMPNKDDFPGPDAWRNPIFYRDQPAQHLRQGYGFRRPYFGNTHHYFAFLKYAEELPSLTGTVNYERELSDLRTVYNETQVALNDPLLSTEVKADFRRRYAWFYLEGVNDLYITDHSIQAARIMRSMGIGILPDYLYDEMCVDNEEDVWSLDSTIASYYFRFPRELWPDEEYWP